MTTAHRIREARLRLNLSQEGFAQKLGVSTASVSRWERGETLPRNRAKTLLVELTGMPADSLAPEDESDAASVGVPNEFAPILAALEHMLNAAKASGSARDRRRSDKKQGRRTALASAAAAPSTGSMA